MQDELLARAARLERFAQIDPGNHALRVDLARTYHLAGQREAALGVLDGARAGDAPQGPLPLRGELLLALGRWEEAVAFYRETATQDPASAAIAFNLAYATWASGAAPEQTVALFRMAVKLDPAHQRAWRLLATALSEAGESASALQTIEQAVARLPEDAQTLQLAAQLNLDAGRLEAAARYAERSIAAAPSFADAWATRGTIAQFAMDAASAWKYLRQAADLAPRDVDTRVSLAQAALMQGRARQARAVADEALRLEPANDAALCILGWACLSDDDAAAAAAAFARASTEAPDSAEAWAGAAVVALAAGRNDEARTAADQALRLDPQQPAAALVRARLQEDAGEDPKAAIEAVLRTGPGGPVQGELRTLLGSAPARSLIARQQRRLARQAQARRERTDPSKESTP